MERDINIKCFIIGKGRGIRMTTFSPNVTTENVEETNGTSTPEEEILDKNSQDVLVIPFGPTIGESVGLLSEQKVCIYIIELQHAVYLSYIFN